MKKLLIAVCFILLLTGCGNQKSDQSYLKELCGLDIAGSTVIARQDTHGGFLGDGVLVSEISCAAISDSVTQQMDDWRMLPLSETLQMKWTSYDLSQKYGIPDIDNGYYLFINRQSVSNIYDDTNLLGAPSDNFTLLLYDLDSDTLYLIEIDT